MPQLSERSVALSVLHVCTYVLFPDIFSHSVQGFMSVSVVYEENCHMVFYKLPDLMFVFGVFVIASLES